MFYFREISQNIKFRENKTLVILFEFKVWQYISFFHGISAVLPILSHIPVPTRGKDKNPPPPPKKKKKKKRTAARRPPADRTSIRDGIMVIVMLKLRRHVASQPTQDFLEVFFMFFIFKIWCTCI